MSSALEAGCASSGVTPAAITAAADRIRPHLHLTPLLTSTLTDVWLSGTDPSPTSFFKCENFQKTGSFKARGATNALALLHARNPPPPAVVAHSSGNHAQALAFAASLFSIPAHVVVPHGSARVKLAAARRYGAVVHPCQNSMPARHAAAAKVIADTSGILVHPFLHPDIVAGQGTLGLELTHQTHHLDAVVVPIGGGGLISGVAIAVKSRWPSTRIFGAEPVLSNAAARSLSAGHRVDAPPDSHATIADGLRAGIGELGWQICSRLVDDVITVTEHQIREAFAFVLQTMKLVIEPSAAVAVAACRTEDFRRNGFARVGVVLCGGNVDLEKILEVVL